jgi:hypothetical protein
MIEDDVIRGVRAAREEYARSHGFNIRAMVADLQARDLAGDWPVVSRLARHPHSADSQNQALQPTGVAISVSRDIQPLPSTPAAEL